MKKSDKRLPDAEIPDLTKMSTLAIGRWLKKTMEKYGLSQKEMSKRIGYSQSYVTIHLTLLSLPKFFTPLIKANTDYSSIYGLAKIYEKHADLVEAWMKKNPTPSSREIRQFLRESKNPEIAFRQLHDLDSFPYNIVATITRPPIEGIVLQQPKPEGNKVWLHLIKSGKIRSVTVKSIKTMRFEPKK